LTILYNISPATTVEMLYTVVTRLDL